MTDGELLSAYAHEGSESAFATLVSRYVGLVHSVASRQIPDSALAEDITQSVFVLLARQARRLTKHPSLAGWLHQTAWQMAARATRAEIRRRRREIAASQTLYDGPAMPTPPDPTLLVSLLDEALQDLPEPDRTAIVQRYLLRRPFREVGAALGTTDAAAKMRVRRALDHLRNWLARRGITCSPAALASALTHQGMTSVSPALAARVTSAALQTGGALPLSLFLQGLLSVMNGTKLTVIVISAALIAAFSIATSRLWRGSLAGHEDSSQPSVDGGTQDLSAQKALGAQRRLGDAPPKQPVMAEDLTLARQRLREALTAPPLEDEKFPGPNPAVLEAMTAFGNWQGELFVALQEVLLDPNTSHPKQYLVQTRAFDALGSMDKNLPRLLPFLWQATHEGNWGGRLGAFMALKRLGFDSSDLPALTRLLRESSTGGSPALRMFLPEAIQELILRNPTAASEHLGGLVQTLNEASDLRTRFSAASTLLGTPSVVDSRVIETLRQGLREGLNVSPTDYRGMYVNAAIQHARAAAEAAKPLVPDLLVVARTSHKDYERDQAWQAIDQIQPELRTELPDLDEALTRIAGVQQLRETVTDGFGTQEDLVRALSEPATALKAAISLGESGVNAPEIIPAMLAALPSMKEEDREKVVKAIRQLNPQMTVERVPSDVMVEGVIFANSALDRRPNALRDPRVEQVLLDQEAFNTWRTPDEILGVMKKLAELDAETARAFADGLAEKDAVLASRARQFLPPATPP
ncbi:MAG: sigma-70 family RNA polymerase sigma factor [Verrucomicrobia bacterium]|nr:sigma-70 family RNA polymerase sigma factor [Verrucomicrobiota bacterium]